MDSAEYYINTDDDFCLSHLPCLPDLLMWGITLSVENKYEKYHDMTLTQYSAASRKPNALKLLLQMEIDSDVPFNDIIFPKTSNTKQDLFEICIRFGAGGTSGDSGDNRCLEVLMEFVRKYNPDFNVDFQFETPLITAINCNNEKAIKLLLDNKADLFHTSKIEDNENESNAALRMPIMKIFQSVDNKGQLKNLFDTVLKDYKNEIIEKCLSLKIGDKMFTNFLRDNGYLEARSFLLDYYHPTDDGPIPVIDPSSKAGPNVNPPTKEEKVDQNDPEPLCSFCKELPIDGHCEHCHGAFCSNCLEQSKHNCRK